VLPASAGLAQITLSRIRGDFGCDSRQKSPCVAMPDDQVKDGVKIEKI
jgi:hypothetical protein